ncbi:hypothetical protein [Priestia megaterium]|uniref:hypothetical protein n=1 Tax=Priestia megaterium TaxID=1404 RepID=UPI000BFDD21D|nr:hypothetical protein [Priestia megaterium]PGO60669.1 hypothetical protein CN981_08960 [Priestia megaterium]
MEIKQLNLMPIQYPNRSIRKINKMLMDVLVRNGIVYEGIELKYNSMEYMETCWSKFFLGVYSWYDYYIRFRHLKGHVFYIDYDEDKIGKLVELTEEEMEILTDVNLKPLENKGE